jgi:hypothetical protein
LFDFKIYRDKDLLLFGYIENENRLQKVELHVKEFEISCQMNIDKNIFKSAEHMVENYLYAKNKNLRNLVQSYKEIKEFTPFKGAKTE